MAKKKIDFLHEAAGQFLSDFPEKWSGEKIVKYLEDNADDYDDTITPWIPFEGYCGAELAEYITDLASKYEYFYNLKK